MFKKEFVMTNQVARKNAKTPMGKKIYKLMNNSNFGYDCCNNFNICYFTPVINEIEETAYIRKHQSIQGPSVTGFFQAII